MTYAYLTIDDSPSLHTASLTDFLVDQGIPALLFCRGDMIEQFGSEQLVYAARRGLTLGNHSYHHYRASEKDFATLCDEILRTEDLINAVYTQAEVERGNRYFRFPHIDRGTGGWIINYNQLTPDLRENVISVFSDGLNIDLTPPTPDQMQKKEMLQHFLLDQGFSKFPSALITLPWYQNSEMKDAIDVLYTYSTSDWMLLNRHRGNWPYQSENDLKAKIDADPWLQDANSAHILLAHDKDEIEIVVRNLVNHCLDREITFLPIP